MEKKDLISLREQINNLPPEIAENQKTNKNIVSKLQLDVGIKAIEDKTINKLDELLLHKVCYFDPGYFCEYTPEQLQEEILKELDRLIEEK